MLGFVNSASFGSRNAGFRKVEGFDVDMSYRWDAGRFGKFSIVSNSTYTARDYFLSTNDPRIPISSDGTRAPGGCVSANGPVGCSAIAMPLSSGG